MPPEGRRRGRGVVRRCGSLALGPAVLIHRRVFEDRVLLHLLLDEAHQVQLGQLEQLDRLLQLRRHHQLLGEFELLLEFDRHGVS
jgi:hypothetical protein